MIAAISVGAWPHASDVVGRNGSFDSFDRAASAATRSADGMAATTPSDTVNNRFVPEASQTTERSLAYASSVSRDGCPAILASRFRSRPR